MFELTDPFLYWTEISSAATHSTIEFSFNRNAKQVVANLIPFECVRWNELSALVDEKRRLNLSISAMFAMYQTSSCLLVEKTIRLLVLCRRLSCIVYYNIECHHISKSAASDCNWKTCFSICASVVSSHWISASEYFTQRDGVVVGSVQ